ncbi:MAG: hypothetical protein LBN27_01970 [Prevotellaceae bacterium]|nr:hypothetical protein [Prevotellaceae bacterium]
MKIRLTKSEKISSLALIGLMILIVGAVGVNIARAVWEHSASEVYLFWWLIPALLGLMFWHILVNE